jgi:carbamate kinase
VPSDEPQRIFEMRPIRWLLAHDTIVIAAGGGGIPTMYQPGAERTLTDVECVIDKDFASKLLARELDADVFGMLTDADAVYAGWGTPAARRIRHASPEAIASLEFAAGSMGPKVEAVCMPLSCGSMKTLEPRCTRALGSTWRRPPHRS